MRLRVIVFLLFVGCSDKKEEKSIQEVRPSLKGGGSSVIAPINRVDNVKRTEEMRQLKVKKAYESVR